MLNDVQRAALRDIDAQIAAEGVPIPYRPLHGMGRFAVHFDIEIDGDSSLAEDIAGWFDAQYGDRVVATTLLGRLPVEIRGDIYALNLAPAVERGPDGRVVPVIHWGLVAGQQLRESLTATERHTIDDLVSMGRSAFSELAPHVCERVLSTSATHDLDIAIDELLRPEFARAGLSKWASSQAAEKSLKEFIARRGGTHPRNHDILRLHAIAVSHGLPSAAGMALPEGQILDLIQCSPGVRYGEVAVTPAEAIGAYYAALVLCSAAAAKLRVEAGARCWLYLKNESPGLFVIKRIAALAGIRHNLGPDRP